MTSYTMLDRITFCAATSQLPQELQMIIWDLSRPDPVPPPAPRKKSKPAMSTEGFIGMTLDFGYEEDEVSQNKLNNRNGPGKNADIAHTT